MKHEIILYHCGHTARYDSNTGIQRVVRNFAKTALAKGIKLVPIEMSNNGYALVDEKGIEWLSKFNGPSVESWGSREDMAKNMNKATAILIPELFTPAYILREVINEAQRRKIVTHGIFFDAIPTLFPKIYLEGATLHLEFMREMNRLNKITAISKSSANDFKRIVSDIYSDKNAKVSVVTLPQEFLGQKRLVEKKNLTKNINVIFVSSVEVRKNHINFLKALKLATKDLYEDGYSIKLDIVGGNALWGDYKDAVHGLINSSPNVEWHVGITDEQLRNLYENADFSAYPSIYEGYGLPIAESLYFNTPVICSDNSSLLEVSSGAGCIIVDPYDVEDIKNQIINLAKNSDLRSKKVKEVEKFKTKTWKEYVDEVLYEMGDF